MERGFRRVARYADGWMTNKVSPAQFREQWARIAKMAREEGRNPDALGSALYHNININEDRQQALEESKTFLDTYYTSKFSPAFVEGWTVAGTPAQCIAELRAYVDAGLTHIAFGSPRGTSAASSSGSWPRWRPPSRAAADARASAL